MMALRDHWASPTVTPKESLSPVSGVRVSGRLKPYAEMSAEYKRVIREAVNSVVQSLSSRMTICVEAVAREAFYSLQRHRQWRVNPTTTQKRASFDYWEHRCHRCNSERKIRFRNAVFHHLERGVPNQHGPANMVPVHARCHDKLHGAVEGSLSKGSPRKKSAGRERNRPAEH